MSISCPIIFDAEKHSYTRISDGQLFKSVTTFIGEFKPKTDFEKIAERIALRRGVVKQEVLNEWE